ncbi:MAG: phosphoribosylanthranilate isomerase [Bacteroidales bacterium]|nr:phosphoribosylanthranilate isomerase [Bacteroidales bacterium]
MKNIKIKVCGMRDPDNIRALTALDIDFIGFVFYKDSPRYAGKLPRNITETIPENIRKAGVFVDENPCLVESFAKKFNLDYVQLHGDETPEYCRRIREEVSGIKIIKAFGIKDPPDNDFLKEYAGVADFFLFDTYTSQHGGSGITFNKEVLAGYDLNVPFFLSGGIDESILDDPVTLKLPRLYALDINSRFERAPGVKNISRIQNFVNKIKL